MRTTINHESENMDEDETTHKNEISKSEKEYKNKSENEIK